LIVLPAASGGLSTPYPMNKLFILTLLLFSFSFSFSQSDSLRDYRWQIGYGSNPNTTEYGGTDFNFHESPVELSYQYRELNFDITNASICDQNGELLFYSNGIRICNSFGDTITNGNGLNPGIFADEFEDYGYPVPNGAFILPAPENNGLYSLIHERFDLFNNGGDATSFHLYFSLVDMTSPQGLVMSKNNLILYDTFDVGHTTAVRHANGRDWWILKARFDTNQFHTFLLDPSGIQLKFTQPVGNPIDGNGGLSQAVFSPDGTKYARNDGSLIAGPQFVKLYDFDRCSGILSNMREAIIPDTSYGSGIAFSPNSRYLYTTITDAVFQYDTEAPDFNASQELLATWEGDYCPAFPLAANFFMMQLAPDNKIYINSTNGVNCMHVIHNPDQAGVDCNFEKMGLQLPTYNSFSLPHFPYFRLGALPGSPCDTLGLTDATSPKLRPPLSLTLAPNPATDHLSIQLKNLSNLDRLEVRDALGKQMMAIQLAPETDKLSFDISNLPNGIYFISCFSKNKLVVSEKLVKQ
jgi:hypothetical protein